LEPLNHIDLFSGIGGFAYAAREVWGEEYHNVLFCDNNAFCREVIKKNFGKDSVIYGDIKELTLLPTYDIIKGKGGGNESKVSGSGKSLQSGVVDRRNSGVFQNNPSGDVENSKTPRSDIPKQSEIWGEEPFLSGNASDRSGAEHRRTRSQKRDIETPADLPDLQGDRKFKRDRGSSSGLCEAVRDTMAMPALPSQMAQRTYRERIVLNERPFLLTAGIPCQPASCAGKRRGTKDDRWLWPEAFRIIRETQPRWVILENVRGILTLESGLVFKSLLAEMEGCGYETREYVIPACAVGAPHR
jgi:hypothetical protein